MINKFDIAELLLKVALNTISHQPLINKLINFILIHTDICIDIIIKQGQDIYPLTSLIPPHFYICNQPGHKSPLAYEEVFFYVFCDFCEWYICSWSWVELYDNRSLHFLFIIYNAPLHFYNFCLIDWSKDIYKKQRRCLYIIAIPAFTYFLTCDMAWSLCYDHEPNNTNDEDFSSLCLL
jgi:hypothetical protein